MGLITLKRDVEGKKFPRRTARGEEEGREHIV